MNLEETLMEKTPKELLEEISQIGKTEKLRVQELNAAIEEVSVHVHFFPQNAEQLICTSPERSQQEGRCLPLCSSGRGFCGTAPRKKLQEIQRRGVCGADVTHLRTEYFGIESDGERTQWQTFFLPSYWRRCVHRINV